MGWQCVPAPVIFNIKFEFVIQASRAKLAPTEKGTRDTSVVLIEVVIRVCGLYGGNY